MITKYQGGVIGNIGESSHDTNNYNEAIQNYRFDRALEDIWDQVKSVNQYIDEQKPWEIAKTKDEDHLREVLAYTAGMLIQIAHLPCGF